MFLEGYHVEFGLMDRLVRIKKIHDADDEC
jgi:hypothetical protein